MLLKQRTVCKASDTKLQIQYNAGGNRYRYVARNMMHADMIIIYYYQNRCT
jgi:hypothetical protein